MTRAEELARTPRCGSAEIDVETAARWRHIERRLDLLMIDLRDLISNCDSAGCRCVDLLVLEGCEDAAGSGARVVKVTAFTGIVADHEVRLYSSRMKGVEAMMRTLDPEGPYVGRRMEQCDPGEAYVHTLVAFLAGECNWVGIDDPRLDSMVATLAEVEVR